MYHLDLIPGRRFWNHYSNLDTELGKFFETFGKTDEGFNPTCEILDMEKYFSISVDVPGVKKEDISIEIKENQLYVNGERKSFVESQKENMVRTEKRYGKFSRVFTLPQNVNTQAIEAKFDNGVLEVILPKEEKAMARKIEISDWKDSSFKN